jgi:TolA-binding protein
MIKTYAFVLAVALAAVLATTPAAAQTPNATTQTAGLKEVLQSLWGKLRALTPRSDPPAATTATVTAGLRGIEATESELRPYWRGEREACEQAQAHAEAGKFADAARAFEAFVQQNPSSPLAPNARFGAALARAALGERSRAIAGFEDFLKSSPQHPLARDAEQALAALR